MKFKNLYKYASLFNKLASITPSEARLIMNLPSSFSPEQLEKAYKKKVFELHPDRNHSETANTDFITMKSAYEFLKNKNHPDFSTGNYNSADIDNMQNDAEQEYQSAANDYNQYSNEQLLSMIEEIAAKEPYNGKVEVVDRGSNGRKGGNVEVKVRFGNGAREGLSSGEDARDALIAAVMSGADEMEFAYQRALEYLEWAKENGH